jgi:hypothetical protein
MIERLIYIALQQGLADVITDPHLLERYFEEQHGLDPSEIAGIRALVEESPPTIIHQYPRVDSTFPLYAIVLAGERETTSLLGDDGNDIFDDDDDDRGSGQKAQIWDHDHTILCVSQHPDVTRYIYELAKFFLIRAIDFFISNGLLDTKLSGADLAPDPRYIPAHLFVRQLTMTATREHRQLGERLRRATRIAGVHVDDGAAIGVETQVSVFENEEES